MNEIRPIAHEEGAQFLRLLCEVFGLDFRRAESVFFNEPLYDPKRKWALFENGEMQSILTTVPLTFGDGPAIGIAGVATKASRQSEGLAGQLLERVLQHSDSSGEGRALLFAKDERLYHRHGFQVLDEVVRSPLTHSSSPSRDHILALDEIRAAYDRWSDQDPRRLRRDDTRWAYWKWNLRVCTALQDGYICHEGLLIREIVAPPGVELQLPQDAEWQGLTSMANLIGLKLENPTFELHLMGRGFDFCPQMFMTDQF